MSYEITDYERRILESHVGKHPGAAKILDRGEIPDVAVGNSIGGQHLVVVDSERFLNDEILDHPDRDIVEYLLLMGYTKATILVG